MMCETLGVSKSGFHSWEKRVPSDRALSHAWLTSRITEIHENARGVYGSRRVQAELSLAKTSSSQGNGYAGSCETLGSRGW